MSTSVAAGRQLAVSARTAAWAGIALGIVAAYVALPPLMIRTPAVSLVLAALGIAAGVYATRSGEKRLGWRAVGLEGMMLMGAFFGIFGADLFGSWFLGILVGVAAGALMGLIHAFVSIRLRADQVGSGTGINILAIGI